MRVRVLYFAGARDAVGASEETREIADGATVADFTRAIAAANAELGARIESVRVARNERFADPSERIEDGDVLAIIPPVAGG